MGDVSESFHFCKYKRPDQIIIFADDYTSRWLTSGEMLDYDTMVAADKFGNLSVVRLPAEVSEDVEEDPTGARFKVRDNYLCFNYFCLSPLLPPWFYAYSLAF